MFLLLLALEVIPFVLSQATHTVSVGVQGSVFDPSTIAAATNDTIEFLFLGDIHTVTQTTFEQPCVPLKGGFGSGLFGKGANFTDPGVQWSMTVTNASAPIWFFCAATRPISHCAQGMVGAINPPSQDMFTRFQNAAKAVSGTAAFLPTLALSGIGATASTPVTLTSTDVPPPTSSPSAGSTAAASPSTMTSAPTNTPAQKASPHGAVIGGAVGGALGGVILLLLGVILCYRIKNRRNSSADASYLSYNPQPLGSPHNPLIPPNSGGATVESFSPNQSPNYVTAFDASEANSMSHKQSAQTLMRARSANTFVSDYSNAQMGAQPLYPVRAQQYDHADPNQYGARNATIQGLGAIYNGDNNPSINRQQSSNAIEVATAEGQGMQPNRPARSVSPSVPSASEGVDIQALAKEVAAVLQQGKKSETAEEGSREGVQSPHSPPPRYHAVNN